MTNQHNLDIHYFSGKLKLVLEGINNYTPEELARELTRLANTACHKTVGDTYRRSRVPEIWNDPYYDDLLYGTGY